MKINAVAVLFLACAHQWVSCAALDCTNGDDNSSCEEKMEVHVSEDTSLLQLKLGVHSRVNGTEAGDHAATPQIGNPAPTPAPASDEVIFAASPAGTPAPTPAPTRQAGIMYNTWHVMPAHAMSRVAAMGGELLTTEKVIQSNGAKTLDDVYKKYGHESQIWNVEPAELGFYCLYTKRPGDTTTQLTDCPDTKKVARRHAQLLVDAGFDYVYVDNTNWRTVSGGVDHTILRPMEVLIDHWLELRAEGVATPDVVAWPKAELHNHVDGQQPTWQWVLDNIYNDPQRSSIIWRRPGNGDKKVMFVAATKATMDPSVKAKIESNGGKNDIETIDVWTSFDKSDYHQGMWGFISACHDNNNHPTTSHVGDASQLGVCDQDATYQEDGTDLEISASAAYHLSHSGLPFGATGKMRGLPMQRMFKKVLQRKAPNLIMSSFNEHIGGRQVPKHQSAISFCMGLPNDPQKDKIWVDTYGYEHSRDIEPSVEGGDLIYRVTASCVKMYKAGTTCEDASTELCCTTEDKEIWNDVWSLEQKDTTDHMLTTSHSEKEQLVGSGAWVEKCVPHSGASVFCVGGTDGRDGPFMVYNRENAIPKAKPLYQCLKTLHYFPSNDETCEGGETKAHLGYVSATRGGETVRALLRCKNSATGAYSHSLDIPCPDGEDPDGELGYVK